MEPERLSVQEQLDLLRAWSRPTATTTRREVRPSSGPECEAGARPVVPPWEGDALAGLPPST